MVSQATEILEKERRRADGLENELAELRPSIERCELRLRDAAATAPQSQEPDREKSLCPPAGSCRGAARANGERGAVSKGARRRTRSQRRSGQRTGDGTAERRDPGGAIEQNPNEAVQLKKAADTAASELQRERERAEALASELAKVRREVETAAAVSSQKDDEAVQQKQTAEAAIAELQQFCSRSKRRPPPSPRRSARRDRR